MDASASHPLLRRLLRRAEQPGLVPMELARRILSQVRAQEERLELLTRLVRRYTVGGGFGANQVPIVHAQVRSTEAWRGQAASAPVQTALAPERLIVKASMSPGHPAGLNPVIPLGAHTAAAPGEAQLPTPRVMPLTPVEAATPGGVPAGNFRRALPLVIPLPPVGVPRSGGVLPGPTRIGASTPGGAPSGEARLPAPPDMSPPPAEAVASSGVPAGASRLPLPLVTPLPPMGTSMPGAVPPRTPRPPLLRVQPPGVSAPDGAPSAGARPPLPLTTPRPPVGAPLPGGEPPTVASPRLPQVVPHPPAEDWHRSGSTTPLVHPQRGPSQASGSSPTQEAAPAVSRQGPSAVHRATTPPSTRGAPPAATARTPSPRPELDLDVLASKVRQRLLRQFSEEKVRRGGLK